MPRGRLARTCGRDSSTSRRGGVGAAIARGGATERARGDGAAPTRGAIRRGEPGGAALSLKKSAHEGESGGGTGATNSATRRTRPPKKSSHSFFLRGSIAKSEFEGAATGDPAATAGDGAAGECARFGKRRGWGEPATAGATGCGGSGRCGAPRAKNERNDKGALLRFARGDAVGEGAVGAALRRGEPRGGDAAAAAAEGAALAARPGEVAEPREVAGGRVTGSFPPAPNFPGCGRFTNRAPGGGTGGAGGARKADSTEKVIVSAKAADSVASEPPEGASMRTKPPACMASAAGTYASRIRTKMRPAAVRARKR